MTTANSTLITPRNAPAVPCNTLIDSVHHGTLQNVCQTLSMLACLDADGLTTSSAMGLFRTLIACIDALEYEIARAISNTEADSHE